MGFIAAIEAINILPLRIFDVSDFPSDNLIMRANIGRFLHSQVVFPVETEF
jgi:hypothetical protein